MDKLLQLKNGMKISYYIVGKQKGHPVLYFHGCPSGSRKDIDLFKQTAEKLDLKLIGIDRPGYGYSTFRKVNFQEFANMMQEFTDKLKLNNYVILGTSGGGPYALACASNKNNINTFIVSSICCKKYLCFRELNPLVKFYINNSDTLSVRFLFKLLRRLSKSKHNLASILFTKYFIEKSGSKFNKLNDNFLKNRINEAMRFSINGVINDLYNFKHNLVNLNKIKKPVEIIYGKNDNFIPVTVGKYFNQKIPTSNLKIVENHGHFCLISDKNNILNQVAQRFL